MGKFSPSGPANVQNLEVTNIHVENTSGDNSHKPQPPNNIAVEKVATKQPQWGSWSSWVLDEQHNRYYRFRQDSEGVKDSPHT
jgi:hypothetical protein